MKQNIGIMSMQRIFNYGSFLQAYSLKRIIESLNYDVRFVDYHPGNTIVPNNSSKLNRNLIKAFETIKLKAPFKEKIKFISYKKNYAKKYFPLLDITDEKNYATDDLHTLVIGSDEVFNCIQNNSNVGLSPDLFGANNQAERLISYAASFGNTTLSKVNKYKLNGKIKNWLENFNAISVRDDNSANIVKNLTGVKPNINLDPVLIYFDKKNLKDNLKKVYIKSNYLVLYGYTGRFTVAECNIIRSFANSKNLKILCIGGIQHCCDEFIDCDPFEVLGYFKNAEFIITDTFHGSIMSIINNKKFAVLVRNTGYGNSQKLNDLLKRLGLEERKISKLEDLNNYFTANINYSLVNSKLTKERAKTFEFLNKNL